MQRSIRERAIAIDNALTPGNYAVEGEVLSLPEMKVEADAHLAIMASVFADRVINDQNDQDSFVYKFSKQILDTNDVDKRRPNVANALDEFSKLYSFEFTQKHEQDILEDTPIGRATAASCKRYHTALLDHAEANGIKIRSEQSVLAYDRPARLMALGLNSLVAVTQSVVAATYSERNLPITPERRLKIIKNSEINVKQLGSLALHQMDSINLNAHQMKIYKGRVQLAKNIQATRMLTDGCKLADTRSHQGCPALPRMPEGNDLVSGSAISKLYGLAVDLIERTDLHALDEKPKGRYKITGQRVYETAVKNLSATGNTNDHHIF